MIRVQETSYTYINKTVKCPECGKQSVYIGTIKDDTTVYCDSCDATFKANLVMNNDNKAELKLDKFNMPKYKGEGRSWGRSKANHQYKDLGYSRGTSCSLMDIKKYVDDGDAEDITNYSSQDVMNLYRNKRLEVIGKSRNGNGYNGVLLRDRDTGDLYAITKRCSNIMMFT